MILPTRTSPKFQCAAEEYHLFVIFAVLDVSLAVNLCISCSFLHLYLQFYYISELLQQNCLLDSFVLTRLDHANQFLVFFHLNFLFDST